MGIDNALNNGSTGERVISPCMREHIKPGHSSPGLLHQFLELLSKFLQPISLHLLFEDIVSTFDLEMALYFYFFYHLIFLGKILHLGQPFLLPLRLCLKTYISLLEIYQ